MPIYPVLHRSHSLVGMARRVLLRVQRCAPALAAERMAPRDPPCGRRRRAAKRTAGRTAAALITAAVLTGVTHTIVRDGRVVAEVRAAQVWNFRRRARTILQDVRYAEYDAAGNAATTGSADRAVYYTEREDAALSGSIRLRSEAQGVTVQAQALRWEDDRRRLVPTPGDVAEFTRDDGSQVRGDGLEADVRRKTIRFSGAVSGTLVTESDNED